MWRTILTLLAILLIPTSTFAARGPATFAAGRSLVVASTSLGNAYFAGVSVVSTAPVAGDLSAIGGSIVTAASVQGDEFLLAGSIRSQAPIAGDLRTVGGSITIEGPVAGDIVAFGLSVHDSGRIGGSVFIVSANTTLSNGASGPVIIYGNNISLGGDFAENITIVATGRLSLSASTTIRGKLVYEAPEPAAIPTSVSIQGGVEYTNASYLPDVGTSRILALVSIGFFLFARILGALILAGLLAGLFPRFSEAVVEYADGERPRNVLLTMLLGFAILVATPVLLVLLSLTFVGIGLALLLGILYALLVLLSLLYAGILLGSLFARRFWRRKTLFWHDGMLGMLVLSLIALVPVIGLFVALLLTIFSSGVLLQLFFRFAFPHEEQTPELL